MIELESASVVAPTASGSATILQPTTLSLTEQRISIIGANGSGKSTLARLFNGLIPASSGTVRVRAGHNGETALAAAAAGETAPTAQPSQTTPPAEPGTTTPAPEPRWFDTSRQGAEARRLVGFVFTDPSAQLVMPTVREDVALSLRRLHRRKHDRLDAAQATLERFGLAHLADRSVHTLSGGQRQLLALTAVLATEPAILVADEPTTLLDLRNSVRIGDLLMQLPQQVVIVTHDLELAARADRTLVIDDARVVFDGRPDEAIEHYRAIAAEGTNGPHP